MTAVFGKSVLAYTNPSDVHLLNSTCQAYDGDNTNIAVVSTDYHACGTHMKVNVAAVIRFCKNNIA